MPEILNARQLPDIEDVPPLSAADEECLSAVREVLRQHGALQRFGVALLHSHFPLDADEVLLEEVDVERRVLTHRVASRRDLTEVNVVGTIWRLDDLPEDDWSMVDVQQLAKDLCRNVCAPERGHPLQHRPIGN